MPVAHCIYSYFYLDVILACSLRGFEFKKNDFIHIYIFNLLRRWKMRIYFLQSVTTRTYRPVFAFLIACSIVCLSPVSQAVCGENSFKAGLFELEKIKSQVARLCSMPQEEQANDLFYQSLMNMKEKDYDRVLKRFEGSTLYRCLLGIREYSPYIASDEWGDWADQTLAFSPPPGGFHAARPGKKMPLVPERNFMPDTLPDLPGSIGDGIDIPLDAPFFRGPGSRN